MKRNEMKLIENTLLFNILIIPLSSSHYLIFCFFFIFNGVVVVGILSVIFLKLKI